MVFSSAISLFFFVPIVFLLDRRLSNMDAKNTWLLLASLVFYSFGQVYYLPLLLLSVALNYVCGRLAAGKYAKLGVTLAVIGRDRAARRVQVRGFRHPHSERTVRAAPAADRHCAAHRYLVLHLPRVKLRY